jgi:hypothetical protein
MSEEIQKLLERAIKAETQAEFLYEALHKIVCIAPFDKCYYIAEAACLGYKKTSVRNEKKEADVSQELKEKYSEFNVGPFISDKV